MFRAFFLRDRSYCVVIGVRKRVATTRNAVYKRRAVVVSLHPAIWVFLHNDPSSFLFGRRVEARPFKVTLTFLYCSLAPK
jgi:hypothetical protein